MVPAGAARFPTDAARPGRGLPLTSCPRTRRAAAAAAGHRGPHARPQQPQRGRRRQRRDVSRPPPPPSAHRGADPRAAEHREHRARARAGVLAGRPARHCLPMNRRRGASRPARSAPDSCLFNIAPTPRRRVRAPPRWPTILGVRGMRCCEAARIAAAPAKCRFGGVLRCW